jgi:hypothetical protein
MPRAVYNGWVPETNMTADLDPTIAALLPTGTVSPTCFDWEAIETITGCPRELYFARMADMLLVQGARLVAGYKATANRSRGARHRAYSEGMVDAPKRETLMDRYSRQARDLGIHA